MSGRPLLGVFSPVSCHGHCKRWTAGFPGQAKGNSSDAHTGSKSMGCGEECHKPRGTACLSVDEWCVFCHRASHNESVCTMRCASQLATHDSNSVLATCVDTHYSSRNTTHPIQSTPHTVPVTHLINTQPQNTLDSSGPKGNPQGDLHTAMEDNDAGSCCSVALPSVADAERLHILMRCPTASCQAQRDFGLCLHGIVQHRRFGLWGECSVDPNIPHPLAKICLWDFS